MKHLAGLLLLLPCTLSAEIYRCEAKGDTYFSQIPCNDGAEAVVIKDQHMFSDPTVPAATVPEGMEAPPAAMRRTASDNLKEFVETLHRQRNEQMAEVDREISSAEAQVAAAQVLPADDPERMALVEKLHLLNTSRASIATQYESMIAEAEKRVAEMSTGGQAVAKAGSQ